MRKKIFLLACLVLNVIACESKLKDVCPPWTILNQTSSNCECGEDVDGIVQCNNKTLEVSVKACYCMTYSEKLNGTFVSYCLYACLYIYIIFP